MISKITEISNLNFQKLKNRYLLNIEKTQNQILTTLI